MYVIRNSSILLITIINLVQGGQTANKHAIQYIHYAYHGVHTIGSENVGSLDGLTIRIVSKNPDGSKQAND